MRSAPVAERAASPSAPLQHFPPVLRVVGEEADFLCPVGPHTHAESTHQKRAVACTLRPQVIGGLDREDAADNGVRVTPVVVELIEPAVCLGMLQSLFAVKLGRGFVQLLSVHTQSFRLVNATRSVAFVMEAQKTS